MIKTVDPDSLRKRRIMRLPKSSSAVVAEVNRAGLVGSIENNIFSTKNGNVINGKLSIMAAPNDIRIGGLWTLNPLLVSTVPSTIVTPMPVFVFNIPGQNFMKDFGTSVAAMLSFLG